MVSEQGALRTAFTPRTTTSRVCQDPTQELCFGSTYSRSRRFTRALSRSRLVSNSSRPAADEEAIPSK